MVENHYWTSLYLGTDTGVYKYRVEKKEEKAKEKENNKYDQSYFSRRDEIIIKISIYTIVQTS